MDDKYTHPQRGTEFTELFIRVLGALLLLLCLFLFSALEVLFKPFLGEHIKANLRSVARKSHCFPRPNPGLPAPEFSSIPSLS